MPKRLALFIDGTWNGPDDPAITHVRRLYLAANAAGPQQQKCHYLAGVGSDRGEGFETPGHLIEAGLQSEAAWVQRQVKNLYSGVTGWGTDFNIRAAYRWLVAHYVAGDEVYFFGFSRGAFAARSLAGFLDIVGVLFKDMQEYVAPLYDLYRRGPAGRRKLQAEVQRLAGRHGPFPRPGRAVGGRVSTDGPANAPDSLRVYFIGVWDTVGAIHDWQRIRSGHRRGPHEVEMPDNVTHVRHALALHELRGSFEPELFERAPTEPGGSLEQVWFAGAHADIGGGYANESALAAVTLEWMAQEAADKGLALDGPIESGFSARPGSKLSRAHGVHNSLSGPFSLMIPRVRRMVGDPDPKTHPWAGRMRVHESAVERLLSAPPPSYCYVDGWVNQVLAEVDECSIHMAANLALLDGGPNSSGPRDPAPRLISGPWWEKWNLKDLRVSFPVTGHLSPPPGKDNKSEDPNAWLRDIQALALVWLICPQRLLERMRIWVSDSCIEWESERAEQYWQEYDLARTEEKALLLLDPIVSQLPPGHDGIPCLLKQVKSYLICLGSKGGLRHPTPACPKMKIIKRPSLPAGS